MSVFVNDKEYEVIDSTLYLDEIYFKKFSDIKGIKNLKDLKRLSLSDNFLENLDGIEVLENLEFLYLKLNYLGEINHINELRNLKELNLEDNGIKIIRGLDNLTNLEILSLSYNNIEKIENLENLKNLRELYLDYNNIKEIEGLENLTNLKTLYLNANEISEIKGLEDLTNLDKLNLEDNPFKEKKEKYLINSDAPLKAIIYYCRTKKLETDEIKLLNCFEKNKNFNENIDILKKSLQTEEISELINIGTHLEKKEIAIMQNLIFYDQIPEEIYLQDKAEKLDKVKLSLIQLNSLKNVKPERDDKIGHFLFFIKQFWDENELNNNVLVYNQDERFIDSKIKEYYIKNEIHKYIYNEYRHKNKFINKRNNPQLFNEILNSKELQRRYEGVNYLLHRDDKSYNSKYSGFRKMAYVGATRSLSLRTFYRISSIIQYPHPSNRDYSLKNALLDTLDNDLQLGDLIQDLHLDYTSLGPRQKRSFLHEKVTLLTEQLLKLWDFDIIEFHEWYEGAFSREDYYIRLKRTKETGLNIRPGGSGRRTSNLRVPLYDVVILLSFGLTYQNIYKIMQKEYKLRSEWLFVQYVTYHLGSLYEAQEKFVQPVIKQLYNLGYDTKQIISFYHKLVSGPYSKNYAWLKDWAYGNIRLDVNGIKKITKSITHQSMGFEWSSWLESLCKDFEYGELEELTGLSRAAIRGVFLNMKDLFGFEGGTLKSYPKTDLVLEVRKAFTIYLLSKGAFIKDIYVNFFGRDYISDTEMRDFFEQELFPDFSIEDLKDIAYSCRNDHSKLLRIVDPLAYGLSREIVNRDFLSFIINLYQEESIEQIMKIDKYGFFSLFS